MKEMMTMEEDTDSIILDREFVSEYSKKVKDLKLKFQDILKAVNSK
jgi:hypothetical protein